VATAERRRGLGDVLHYFIPEEEQRAARERTRGGGAGLRARRWCLPTEPARPLAEALAVDLAAVLIEQGLPVAVAAPFAPCFVRPERRGVEWSVIDLDELAQDDDSDAGRERALLVLVPPAELSRRLRALPEGFLEGVVLPVHASVHGSEEALAALRALPSSASRLRVALLCVGGDERGSDELLRSLERAARRQLGRTLERLGTLTRDRDSFRSLLRDTSVLELEPRPDSAESLRAVGRVLARGAEGEAR
jgi:hypothetical protein